MKIKFNLTGAKRKELVNAVSKITGCQAVYKGAPTFAYETGGYRIDKNGTLQGEDNINLIADLEGLHSFKGVSAEYDMPMTYEESLGGLGALEVFGELQMIEEEELGLGKQRRDRRGENGMQASDVPGFNESETMIIEVPLEGFTEEGIANLEKLIASKASLIKKAIGANALRVDRAQATLKFPWFSSDSDSDETAAYTHLICALCAAAKEQKRVTAKEQNIENEKFAFRVFLIRLGFIGEEYKTARKILLKNLSGNSAFKNGTPSKGEVTADE